MGPFEVLAIAIVLGAVSGIVTKYLDAAAGGARAAAVAELRAARERIRQLEAQVSEADRQREALQEQLAWHAKLLEAHDRSTKPGAGAR
jgi:hypothetical protein